MIQRYDNASGVSMSVDFKRHHYPIAVSLSNFGTTRYHLTRKRMAFCSLSDMAELTYELGQEESRFERIPQHKPRLCSKRSLAGNNRRSQP